MAEVDLRVCDWLERERGEPEARAAFGALEIDGRGTGAWLSGRRQT